ncbi:MAG: hypothetical protein GXO42_01450 [bacterium]|nr:hypothetical protein [bacterium]
MRYLLICIWIALTLLLFLLYYATFTSVEVKVLKVKYYKHKFTLVELDLLIINTGNSYLLPGTTIIINNEYKIKLNRELAPGDEVRASIVLPCSSVVKLENIKVEERIDFVKSLLGVAKQLF